MCSIALQAVARRRSQPSRRKQPLRPASNSKLTPSRVSTEAGHIDSTIQEAAKRGRTDAVLSVIDGRRKACQVLAGWRASEALNRGLPRACQFGRQGRSDRAEAAPIRHDAAPIGAETDSERTTRWLLALLILCCDPRAGALTAASARNRVQSDAGLPEICCAVAA
jgi:hypothetical protein